MKRPPSLETLEIEGEQVKCPRCGVWSKAARCPQCGAHKSSQSDYPPVEHAPFKGPEKAGA